MDYFTVWYDYDHKFKKRKKNFQVKFTRFKIILSVAYKIIPPTYEKVNILRKKKNYLNLKNKLLEMKKIIKLYLRGLN